MQWWWLSSRLCGEERKERRGGRESVREEERCSQVSRSLQYATPKRETRLRTMHACSGIVGCRCREGAMSILLTEATRFRAFAQVSDVRGRCRQASWSEDDLLISGRCLRASPQPLAAGFVVRAYAAGHSVNRMGALCGAMCGVSV